MWCGIIWCSALSGPTTSTKRTSRNSKCCCWPAGGTPMGRELKGRIPRHRTPTTDPEKPRENRASGSAGGLKPGPPVHFVRPSLIYLSARERVDYLPKKNRGAEVIDA